MNLNAKNAYLNDNGMYAHLMRKKLQKNELNNLGPINIHKARINSN